MNDAFRALQAMIAEWFTRIELRLARLEAWMSENIDCDPYDERCDPKHWPESGEDDED